MTQKSNPSLSLLLLVCLLVGLAIVSSSPTWLDTILQVTRKRKAGWKNVETYENAVRQYEEGLRQYENARRRRTVGFWRSLDGKAFEQELARLLRRSGYETRLTPHSGDIGVDIVLKKDGVTTIVQCKAHKNPVGPSVARDLHGSLIHHSADAAILASLSAFTPEVAEYVRGKPITLLGLDEIINLQLGLHGDLSPEAPISERISEGEKQTLVQDEGVNARDRDVEGPTPLHDAARQGDLDGVLSLLREGASVDAVDEWGWTPLFCAASGGHAKVMTLLLEHGADVSARDSEGETPLLIVGNEGADIAAVLLADGEAHYGADVNESDSAGLTLLHTCKDPEVAGLLIRHGAQIDAAAVDGSTPLHIAAHCGWTTKACILLDKGANINALDSHGQTPKIRA